MHDRDNNRKYIIAMGKVNLFAITMRIKSTQRWAKAGYYFLQWFHYLLLLKHKLHAHNWRANSGSNTNDGVHKLLSNSH